MALTDDTQEGFGTGLRAALARARGARGDAPEEMPAVDEAVSSEPAHVIPELRRAKPAPSAAAE